MISFNREIEQNEMFAKTMWMNPSIEYVIRQNIVEYDMQQASLRFRTRRLIYWNECQKRSEPEKLV